MSESDDILALAHPRPGTDFHRPQAQGSTQAACGAVATSEWHRFGMWEARKWNASPCRSCYPQGWVTPEGQWQ